MSNIIQIKIFKLWFFIHHQKNLEQTYGIVTFDHFREISRSVIFVILDQFKVKLGILEYLRLLEAF